MPEYPPSWSQLSTALSHDWLTGMRGGEKVLELLADGFPNAPIYCLLHHQEAVSDTINRHDLRASWLQRIPNIAQTYRYYLPLFPFAIRSRSAPPVDLLISTSHCAAKALPRKQAKRHLCYCFTPMRYAWSFHDEYFGPRSIKQLALRPLLASLRIWDRRTAQSVDRFVAISHHVRRRIEIFYGRAADVVYPPVDTHFYTPSDQPREDFDLVVSALVPYKRIDLVVEAYTHTKRPLVIIGVGTETAKLKAIAGPNIQFLGWQTNDVIRDHYRRCRHLLFPGEEDFGIVPLEAQACGAPVVAYKRGGAMETLVPHQTAIFFEEQTIDGLNLAVRQAADASWDPLLIRENALRFSTQTFIDALAQSIQACLDAPPGPQVT
ncbi:MAG TPA: glycosyltransferase [Kiritimatiellia bacterium]|nr:glycosyltransferase [Kiritimatiellia bacterium]